MSGRRYRTVPWRPETRDWSNDWKGIEDMPIDPGDYEHLLYGVTVKKARKASKIRWVMAMIVMLILDLEMVTIDLSSRSTSVENARKNGFRTNAVLRVPTSRIGNASFEARHLARAES